MNHSEAIDQMAAERYLLDELSPRDRDAFEEHFFECTDCALDLRAGSAFVEEAKAHLPAYSALPVKAPRQTAGFWATLLRPSFAAPVFAALLIVIGYQNIVTVPALRQSADQPRLVPLAPLHGATRGASHLSITADRAHGVALPIELSAEPGIAPAASYAFDLRDPQGKSAWTATVAAPAQQSDSDQPFSLVIPGSMLRNGSYSLLVTSVSTQGERTPVGQYVFDIVLTN